MFEVALPMVMVELHPEQLTPRACQVCKGMAVTPLHALMSYLVVQIDFWKLVVSHMGLPGLYFICHLGPVAASDH